MNNILKEEIEKYISKTNVYFENFSQELKTYLENTYPNLPTIRARWYMLKNNLTDIPACKFPKCINKAQWNERKKKFNDGCCIDHNKRITSLRNFGTEHPNQSIKQKQKVKKSMQKKYGVDYITQTDKHKESVKKTIQGKYGVDNILKVSEIREKIKKTNLEKYGYEEVMASPEIRNKVRKTNLERYGSEESFASPIIRKQINKTNLERYGSIFPMRNEELLEKRRQTIINRYDAYSPFSNKTILQKKLNTHRRNYYNNKLMNNKFVEPLFELSQYLGCETKYEYKCKLCGTIFIDKNRSSHPLCPQCFPKDVSVSNAKTELFEMIHVNNKIQTNRELIPNCEIDIFLPDFNIGIEYNGMYWHSEQKGINKYYHLNKTILSENIGLFLIHIFESEWINRPLQTISLIERYLNKFNTIIDKNTLKIKTISDVEMNKFLYENTLYMNNSVMESRIGAFSDSELVAVMAFEQFENKIIITKFYERIGVGFDGNVFEYLMSFINIKTPIFYYPDRRFCHPNNDMLLSIGFTFEGGTEPDIIYSKNMSHILSCNLNKNNILSYVNEFDGNLTLHENMIFNGYFSIWDCGKLVYKKN